MNARDTAMNGSASMNSASQPADAGWGSSSSDPVSHGASTATTTAAGTEQTNATATENSVECFAYSMPSRLRARATIGTCSADCTTPPIPWYAVTTVPKLPITAGVATSDSTIVVSRATYRSPTA